MKKLIILSTVAVILTASIYAQTSESIVENEIKAEKIQKAAVKKEKREEKKELKKLEGTEVSNLSKRAFSGDFGNIPVTKWERRAYYDVAIFNKDGQEGKAFYDDEAELVGTVTDKTFTDLPAAAQKYINEKYADYSIGSVIFFDDNELNSTDMSLYDTQFDDADNYFVVVQKDGKKNILQVNMDGDVAFFTDEK